MAEEIVYKPEAVWLMEDENMVIHVKKEPETESINDAVWENVVATLDSVKEEFFEGEPEETTGSVNEEVCTKIEIVDNSILEDSLRSSQIFGCGEQQDGPENASTFIPGADNKGLSDCSVLRTHTGGKPFSCTYCNTGFSQQGNLIRHLKLHTGEKPFMCKHCNKSFSQQSYLNIHLRTHTGEKPFSCQYCNKGFSRSSILIVHTRTHTGEKPFSCEHCKKCFRQRTHLIDHIRSHTGEQPFPCKICNKAFRHRSHLVDHVRLHTGEKPYSCNHCDKCFSNHFSLSRHVKSHPNRRKAI